MHRSTAHSCFYPPGHHRSLEKDVILNDSNRGFSAANNQGLSVASGEYFVLLNNDTEVTPTWLRTLLNHMHQNPALGLLGPVTDNIGNEAQIALRYSSANEMRERAKNYTLSHMGETFQIRTLAFSVSCAEEKRFRRRRSA